MLDRSDLDGHQTIKKAGEMRATEWIESRIIDKCVASEWDEDGFMVDLAADAEEIQRELLWLRGAFVAV